MIRIPFDLPDLDRHALIEVGEEACQASQDHGRDSHAYEKAHRRVEQVIEDLTRLYGVEDES